MRLACALLAAALSFVGSLLLPVSSEAQPGQPSPTISGPEIEQLLRTNLEVAPGSGADASQIRCPTSREYRDGDVARCLVPVGNGSVEVLLVTLFKERDGWQFAVDIQ
jgi:hypothetical protein